MPIPLIGKVLLGIGTVLGVAALFRKKPEDSSSNEAAQLPTPPEIPEVSGSTYDPEMSPFKDGYWAKPIGKCPKCQTHDGKAKDRFHSKDAADSQAYYDWHKNGWNMESYECDYNPGEYHLRTVMYDEYSSDMGHGREWAEQEVVNALKWGGHSLVVKSRNTGGEKKFYLAPREYETEKEALGVAKSLREKNFNMKPEKDTETGRYRLVAILRGEE